MSDKAAEVAEVLKLSHDKMKQKKDGKNLANEATKTGEQNPTSERKTKMEETVKTWKEEKTKTRRK